MNKIFVVSILLISILFTSCGKQDKEPIKSPPNVPQNQMSAQSDEEILKMCLMKNAALAENSYLEFQTIVTSAGIETKADSKEWKLSKKGHTVSVAKDTITKKDVKDDTYFDFEKKEKVIYDSSSKNGKKSKITETDLLTNPTETLGLVAVNTSKFKRAESKDPKEVVFTTTVKLTIGEIFKTDEKQQIEATYNVTFGATDGALKKIEFIIDKYGNVVYTFNKITNGIVTDKDVTIPSDVKID